MKLSIKNGAEFSTEAKQFLNFLANWYLSEKGASEMIMVGDIDNILELFEEDELVRYEHESIIYCYAMIGDVLLEFNYFGESGTGIHNVILTLYVSEKSIDNVSEKVLKITGEPLIEEIEPIDLRELVSRAKQYRG